MSNYDLFLFDNLKNSTNGIRGWSGVPTKLWPNWRRTFRDIGGCWQGTATFDGSVASSRLREFFAVSAFRRVVERVSGVDNWEGYISEMELVVDGVAYTWSSLNMTNYARVIYSFIGPNLFVDGSAEGSTWTQVGTPSTFEFTADWYSKGTQSCHVVTDDANEGTRIDGATVAIVAEQAYQVTVSSSIISGEWTVNIHRNDNDDVIASRTSADLGNERFQCQIPATNEYAGAVYAQLVGTAAGAEAYFDAAVFQLAPFRRETGWSFNSDSADIFGRIETILVKGGMTDEGAGSLADDTVTDGAWPQAMPPQRLVTRAVDEKIPASLSVIVSGYVHTLAWLYAVTTGGTDQADNHITGLINESEFITPGFVQANSTPMLVSEEEPITLWDAIEEIIRAGEENSSTRWTGGVYPGRVFNYEERSDSIVNQFSKGKLLSVDGGAFGAWNARPGLVKLPEAPLMSEGISGREQDSMRVIWAKMVGFEAPDQAWIEEDEDSWA